MGLHHQHLHGRVLRGLDARQHLEMLKRDSHGSSIKMNIPDGFAEKQVSDKDDVDDSTVQTVVNVVYITASADFTGSTAGYTTVTSNTLADTTSTLADTTPTLAADTTATTSNANDETSSSATAASSSSNDNTSLPLSTASSSSSVSSAATTTINNKSLFLNPPASATASATTAVVAVVAGSPLSATRSAGAQISNSNDGMTGGAKAGLAFGIIIGFALVAGLLFFCWRRRKNPNAHEELNEKRTSSIFGGKEPETRASVAPSLRSTRTASTAPRLSLRPVTQFLPNLSENRKSAGNLLGIGGASPMAEKPKSTWERRPVGSENPFDDHNEKQDRTVSPSLNPFDEPEGVIASRKRTSADSNGSSTHSKSSEASSSTSQNGAAGARPGAPQGPNNVHRVQLDFKPSMEDELELKSGQLVRMLHEYDDGWALCVRMDRSQQGVAPRTCLSKVPVKPRPQGPPNGQRGPPPGMRGPGPQQGPGMVPRALSPTSPEGAPLDANQAPAVTRKPVPGQAL